jgi:hypothetical protein
MLAQYGEERCGQPIVGVPRIADLPVDRDQDPMSRTVVEEQQPLGRVPTEPAMVGDTHESDQVLADPATEQLVGGPVRCG